MKNRHKKLIHESDTLVKLLFEQEEEDAEDIFAAPEEEEGGEEEGGGDEGADDEAGGDEAGGDEGGEGAADDEEEEKLDVDVEEEVKLSKSIDQDLEALLIDFEAASRKSKQITDEESEAAVIESHLRLDMLLEQDEVDYEDEIDLDRFAAEVARLVKNYTTLLDMEKMLVSKAREFIVTRYGEDAESSLVDILNSQHDIEIEEPVSPSSGEDAPPIAVGAGAGAVGGAGA